MFTRTPDDKLTWGQFETERKLPEDLLLEVPDVLHGLLPTGNPPYQGAGRVFFVEKERVREKPPVVEGHVPEELASLRHGEILGQGPDRVQPFVAFQGKFRNPSLTDRARGKFRLVDLHLIPLFYRFGRHAEALPEQAISETPYFNGLFQNSCDWA